VLDLGNNSVTERGAVSLARLLLAKKASIRDLVMYMNDIGDAGAARLASALRDCKWVAGRWGARGAGWAGAAAVHESLVPHPRPAAVRCSCTRPQHSRPEALNPSHPGRSLKHLDLGGNNIGAEGMQALAASLKSHPSLATLELGYNPLGGWVRSWGPRCTAAPHGQIPPGGQGPLLGRAN
jgi:hypothetical protein